MINGQFSSQFIIDILFLLLVGFLLISFIVITSAAIFLIVGYWNKHKTRHKKALETVLLEVTLPRENEIKIDAAEQMFATLTSIKGVKGALSRFKVPDSLSFEIVAKPQDIRFYVGVNKKYQDMLEKQIHGSYPDASIQEVEDYNIFTEHGEVAAAEFGLEEEYFKPIKPYKDFSVDPLSTIVSTLGKMQEGEAAVLQIIITKAGDSWKKEGREHNAHVKKDEANPDTAKYSVDSKELEGIEQKVSKQGFRAYLRVVVVSSSHEAAEAHLSNIESTFNQYASFNSFHPVEDKFFKSNVILDFIYRQLPLFRTGHMILTVEELATLFHFPNKQIESPHIHWMAARVAPAPGNIPTEGLYLGKSIYRGETREIKIGLDDRRRHMYIIGKTGVGKSEFLKDMILQDIRAGKGVAVIDPHGDLVDDILPLVPPERAEDVIYFDPSDTERPMGLNMLEAANEEQKHFVVNSIIGLMYKLFDPHQTGIIGPRFEHAVRNAMLTVMYDEGATLIEVVRILTDARYVQQLLPKVKDPIIRRYWTDQIAQTSDFHKSEVLDYIVSKFGRFVTNTAIRNIIGQSKSSFNFREIMDKQKILLINLSKGKIGEENSSFLGLILVPRILTAAMSRQDMPMADRKDFYLYVDEFQNFATPDFAQILSEARKYRLNLIVANQFIGQIDEEIKNAIFGNAGTIMSFRVGVSDANYLQHEFQPTFTEADLINVERFHAYVRTLINGEPSVPFSMDLTRDITEEKKQENPRVAELIRELSRLKHGKPVKLIEAEINQRSNLFDQPTPGKIGPGGIKGF
ncbi:MAG: type IV secretion system DNA-binding domain-containing protein [Candidatus Levybacteria bacterium]|nr:type IV secretion system DNA-binding domain-containing protein [Candidatus Levybacteria bacterium]